MIEMTQTNITWIEGEVVENDVHMTIVELSHASRTPEDLIMTWVTEGVLSGKLIDDHWNALTNTFKVINGPIDFCCASNG